MQNVSTHSGKSHPAVSNVETVASVERDAMLQRSKTDVLSGWVSTFAGSFWSVVIHATALLMWIAVNLGWLRGVRPFDPYPFGLLSMIASVEAIFLTTFVLISQNHMNRLEDRRDHLHLQVDILAEQEMTKVLKMLGQICEKLEIPRPEEEKAEEKLLAKTNVHDVVHMLNDRLPQK